MTLAGLLLICLLCNAAYLVRATTDAHLAATVGDTNKIRQLIRENDVNLRIHDQGKTPFHLAIMHGQIEVLKLLLKYGAIGGCWTTDTKESPLNLAVRYNQYKALDLLVQKAYIHDLDDSERTPLQNAVTNNFFPAFALLLENGASADKVTEQGESLLHTIAAEGNIMFAITLFRYYVHRWDRIVRRRKGIIPFMWYNLAPESYINARDNKGKTPLMWATLDGRTELMEWLIENGAFVDIADIMGETSLHYATRKGNRDKVKLLLKSGAHPDVTCAIANSHKKVIVEEATPLDIAIMIKRTDLAALLILYDASVTHRDSNGSTPLHKAAYLGLLETVKILIYYGASIDAVDASNWTPLDLAIQNKQSDVVDYLRSLHYKDLLLW